MSHADFHHEAFFYDDADEFLAGAVPFLCEGLEAGGAALVAVTRARTEALRAELDGAEEQIRFVEMEEVGRNPARIIPVWRRFVDAHGASDRPIRGIGEPIWPRRSPAEIEECQRHESLLNYAFWDGPEWRLLCPYESGALDDDVLEEAHRSHSFVSGRAASQGVRAAAAFDPEDVAPFGGALPPPPAGATTFVFDRPALHEARSRVAAEASRAGLSSDRVFDLIASVGELTANSIMHGGGQGVLSFWQEEGALMVEVEDRGLIEEPLAGRRRPSSSQSSGRGLWMVNHLCDLAQVRSGPAGTTVRVRMGLASSA
jgi:anti-sigma regulatory factor (Ser/Thr protein kinase)